MTVNYNAPEHRVSAIGDTRNMLDGNSRLEPKLRSQQPSDTLSTIEIATTRFHSPTKLENHYAESLENADFDATVLLCVLKFEELIGNRS